MDSVGRVLDNRRVGVCLSEQGLRFAWAGAPFLQLVQEPSLSPGGAQAVPHHAGAAGSLWSPLGPRA